MWFILLCIFVHLFQPASLFLVIEHTHPRALSSHLRHLDIPWREQGNPVWPSLVNRFYFIYFTMTSEDCYQMFKLVMISYFCLTRIYLYSHSHYHGWLFNFSTNFSLFSILIFTLQQQTNIPKMEALQVSGLRLSKESTISLQKLWQRIHHPDRNLLDPKIRKNWRTWSATCLASQREMALMAKGSMASYTDARMERKWRLYVFVMVTSFLQLSLWNMVVAGTSNIP